MDDRQFAKLVVLVNAGLPLALLAWDAYGHHLGADPVMDATHVTGMLALIYLLLSLAITPVRKLTGWNVLAHVRRMLGLFAFACAILHLLIYVALDKALNLKAMVGDLKLPYVDIGLATFLMLVPLAATSTNGTIKRLGAARWKRLHRLAYLAGIGAVIHFVLVGTAKVTTALPWAFAGALGVLLAYRVIRWMIPAHPARAVAARAGRAPG